MLRATFPHGDFFTLNVSSPNTPNLRDLQEKSCYANCSRRSSRKISHWLRGAKIEPKAVFVKIAPDMEFAQVDEIIDVVQQVKLTGIVATNATCDET